MATLKRFAIEQNISIHLVAHQITQRPNKDDGGRLPKPLLNNIKGGGTFADKADNVLFVWRPNRLIDFRDNEVVFGSQKIKKQKLVARPCDIDGITFEFKENRYYFNGLCGLKLIDRKRNAKPEPLEVETSPFPMIALEDIKTVFDNDLPFDDNYNAPF
jgi:twinkle protein